MSFKFDYTEKDWKKRKELVEKYEAEHTMIYDIHELKIKNTKEMKDKNDEVVNHKVESNQELNVLINELIRMYDYVIYAKDKSIKKQDQEKNKKDKKHEKIIIDNEQGIKSYCSPKRGTKYKEVNYYNGNVNRREYVLNNLKRYAENRELINVIIQQQKEYKNFVDEIKIKDSQWFNDHRLRKQNVLTSIYSDINECEKGIENISKVNIKEGIRMKRDILKNVDIEYDEKVIRCVLKNWDEIKEQSYQNVGSTIHVIRMDVENALKKVRLTDKQMDVLCKVFNKEKIKKGEWSSFDEVIKNILDILNKKS